MADEQAGHPHRPTAPVALFVFNRPHLVERLMQVVAKARPAKLFVIADGPRPGLPGDVPLCAQARRAAQQVDWPCEIKTLFSENNLRPRRRIESGLDWVFSQVPEAIVLEDDCLPDPTFFRFCTELLERYRDDERVYMIRGGNHLRGKRVTRHSYYFSRFFYTWGWAGWSRAWRHNDPEMTRWPELRDSDWLRAILPSKDMVATCRGIYDETHVGILEAWEFQWQLSCWLRNAVAIAPAVNLVSNIGFGPDATHLRNPGDLQSDVRREPMRFPLSHPENVQILETADSFEFDAVFPPRSALRRNLRRLMNRDFGGLLGALRRELRRRMTPA